MHTNYNITSRLCPCMATGVRQLRLVDHKNAMHEQSGSQATPVPDSFGALPFSSRNSVCFGRTKNHQGRQGCANFQNLSDQAVIQYLSTALCRTPASNSSARLCGRGTPGDVALPDLRLLGRGRDTLRALLRLRCCLIPQCSSMLYRNSRSGPLLLSCFLP